MCEGVLCGMIKMVAARSPVYSRTKLSSLQFCELLVLQKNASNSASLKSSKSVFNNLYAQLSNKYSSFCKHLN